MSTTSQTEDRVKVRTASDMDLPSVHRIYAHYVSNSLSTFEETPPTIEDLFTRRRTIVQAGLPYLVAIHNDIVVGYAYASLYRPRAAYRFTVEDSVYIDDAQRGRGIGTALISELIGQCEAGDWRQMVAIIGDSGNTGSIALHRRMGFAPVGTLCSVGFKLGRWVDTVIMQRSLGPQ